MTSLVRLLRSPCPGRIARAVGETVNGFARIGDAGYLVRCDTCGHSYHVAAGVLASGVCVRVRREKA
jgi:hypothetical protein